MEICHSASQAKWVHALGLAMKMACCLEFSCLEIMEISRKQLEIAPYCSILLIKGTRLARFQPNIWLQLVIHIVVGLRQLFWNEFEGKTYGTPGVLHVFAINFGTKRIQVSHLCTAPQMLLEELVVGLKVLQKAAANQYCRWCQPSNSLRKP